MRQQQTEIADLLRKHGAKTGEELKAEKGSRLLSKGRGLVTQRMVIAVAPPNE